jgi:hypothetical protein
MLFMNPCPFVSLLLWDINSKGYLKVAPKDAVSLISMKQFKKVVSQTGD